jgi:hypothetical protein
MSEEEKATPAAPVADTSPEMTLDAAAEAMSSWGDDEPAPKEAREPATQEDEVHVEEEEVDEEGSEEQEFDDLLFDKPTSDDEADAEEEDEKIDEPFDWDKVPGDAKFRLKDGRVFDGAFIKKNIDNLLQLQEQQQQFRQQAQQFSEARAQIDKDYQTLRDLAPRAIAAIQAAMPPEVPFPDDELLQTDPFEHQAQMARFYRNQQARQQKAAELQEFQRMQQYEEQRQQAAQMEQMKNQLQQGHQVLLEKLPVLKDKGKRQEFYNKILSAGEHYGYSPQEMAEMNDPRAVLIVRDAMAYRALQKNPPKPNAKGVTGKGRTMAPGKRASSAEVQARKRQEVMSRVNSGGTLEDVAAALTQLDM